jgi:hypothetical protein
MLCLVALAAIAALGCLPVAPADARTHELRLRLGNETNIRVPEHERQSEQGETTLRAPSSWVNRRTTEEDRVDHLAVKLARCEAEVEVRSIDVQALSKPASEEIEKLMDFWFNVFAPVPVPVPLVARRISSYREWALATPPVETEEPPVTPKPRKVRSPYFGVVVQRVASPNSWAALSVGVRTPFSCASGLPHRGSFQSAIETMLNTTAFHAKFGR